MTDEIRPSELGLSSGEMAELDDIAEELRDSRLLIPTTLVVRLVNHYRRVCHLTAIKAPSSLIGHQRNLLDSTLAEIEAWAVHRGQIPYQGLLLRPRHNE